MAPRLKEVRKMLVRQLPRSRALKTGRYIAWRNPNATILSQINYPRSLRSRPTREATRTRPASAIKPDRVISIPKTRNRARTRHTSPVPERLAADRWAPNTPPISPLPPGRIPAKGLQIRWTKISRRRSKESPPPKNRRKWARMIDRIGIDPNSNRPGRHTIEICTNRGTW